MGELHKVFVQACLQLKLEHRNPVLYMARHIGASVDRPGIRAAFSEVIARGR